ncbi:hypothetical protein SEA_OUTIS_37 [Gordonia phage Outis]|nr:hypothetical protein SEA_STARSTRUCK_37 [Gordonia phage StarStruck]WKW85010.1 hypothetical protein SEA_OUTIS_37 [Gordonia phage Outis]
MTFQPVKLVHPKTGVVVEATTAVDFTNFRFADGYLPEDVARTLVDKTKDVGEKYPKLVEGVKNLDGIQEAERAAEQPAEEGATPEAEADAKGEDAPSADAAKVASTKTSKTSSRPSTTAKSGTDASGTDVGVS